MFLSNIKLWNFRKFGKDNEFDLNKPHFSLTFTQGLNLLVGENDSGKTAVIDAIKLVLKTQSYEWIRVVQEDFHNDSDRLRIELRFDDFSDEEAAHFTEWLGWEGEGENSKPFLKLIYDVKRDIQKNRIFPADVRAGVDEMDAFLTAEAKEYLKVTYLKPLRDAEFELVAKKNSRLSQILIGHEAFNSDRENHILLDYLKKFNKAVENYFVGIDENGTLLQRDNYKGKEIKEKIDLFIKSFFGDNKKESVFKITKKEELKNILEKLDLLLKDYFNPGLGTLNRLFIATELLHLQRKNWNGLRLGLIEEIEAHLHPQAQLMVIETLQNQENIQLILTTHSPNLGSKVKLENLILFDNKRAFSLGKKYTKLNENEYKYLEHFLDVTKANLFFAKGVILVEGWSEEILIPALAKKLKQQDIIKKDLTEAGVSIVNIGGTGFLYFSKIFLRKEGGHIDIPVAIITDIDVPEYKKNSDNGHVVKRDDVEDEKTKKTTTKKQKYKEQNVKIFIAPYWTLEYTLCKSDSLKEIFFEIFKDVHSGTKITMENCEEKLAEKLLNKSLKKTEIAYRLAQKLETDISLKIKETDDCLTYLIEAIKYVCN